MQATQTITLVFCLFVLVCFCVAENMMVGGASEAKPANDEIQKIAESLKENIQAKCKTKFTKFELVQFKTQVVAGTNYLMKIDVGDKNYIHIKVFKSLPHAGGELSVTGCEEGKTLDDPINYIH